MPDPIPQLLFYCAAEAGLPALRRRGLRADGAPGYRLHASYEAARSACGGVLIVVDADRLPDLHHHGDEVFAREVPAAALRNVYPYLPPRPIIAGGGYVVRAGRGEPEVLLILRRGLWDLPKGKLDPGESIEQCALREVREEVGIHALRAVRPLGTTVHDFLRDGAYWVKTTHWYLMETPEADFTPQAEEEIEAVDWVSWSAFHERVGYTTLRHHKAQVDGLVRTLYSNAES
jgi:8-oxo-dGTP pyrophosphatase MutT (NUDIX family)